MDSSRRSAKWMAIAFLHHRLGIADRVAQSEAVSVRLHGSDKVWLFFLPPSAVSPTIFFNSDKISRI